MKMMRHLPNRFTSLIAAIAAIATVASLSEQAMAQQAEYPVVEIHGNSASERSVSVQAKGDHDVQSSATLRARGCVGYVADAPSLRLVFHDDGSNAAPIVRATGDEDLVLLVGSANQGWYCNDNTYGTDPEIRLPAGSRTYSVWVGTRAEPMTTNATVRIRVDQGDDTSTVGGACGEASARVPQGVSSSEWSNYSCETSTNAGPRWNLCLPRAAYSDDSEDGCPGAERCCPPAGFEPAVSQDMQAPEGSPAGPVSGMCGEESARRPEGVSRSQWSSYSCEAPGDAGSRWTLCLPRAAYSDMDGDGCPGIERCCPPAGFDPTASSEDADDADTAPSRATSPAGGASPEPSVAPTPRDPADPPPLRREPSSSPTDATPAANPERSSTRTGASTPTGAARGATGQATRPSSGSAETSVPDPEDWDEDILVDQSPYAFTSGQSSVYWRGFATTIPAREQPRAVAPITFDFPVRPGMKFDVDRQWLVIEEPRELIARRELTLTDRVSGESLALGTGDRVELLGAVNSDYCTVNVRSARHEVLCPSRSDFRGADGPFEGLTPEAFRWFVRVRAASGAYGWIEVRTESPLFDIVVE